MEKAPCYGCEVRSPGCHDKCREFQEWHKRLEEINKREKEEYDMPSAWFAKSNGRMRWIRRH